MGAEEYFDVVDEHDNPTGETVKRSIAHAEGIWHRVVVIYFYRQTETGIELLVHLRAKNKDLHPNKWDTRFGGHIKAGEEKETAVIKELQEEVGITVDIEDLKQGPTLRWANYPNNEFATNYYYNYRGDIDTLHFNDGEVQEVKWMNIEAIDKTISQHQEHWAPRYEGFLEVKKMLFEITSEVSKTI